MRTVTTSFALSVALLMGCASKHETPAPVDGLGIAARDGTPAPGTNVPVAVSGTRLRAKHIATADGTRSFVGWYDTERKEDCSFDRAEDGKLRCLPGAIPQNFSNVFSDATCSKQGLVLRGDPSTCGTSGVVAQFSNLGGGCSQSARQLSTATKIPAGANVYTFGPNGSCQATPVKATDSYYAVGAPIAAAAFVEGSEVTEPGDGLVEKHIDTPDGARQHVGWRIGRLGVDCSFEIMGDGVTRCVPDGASGSEIYADSACSVSMGAEVNDFSGPCGGTRPTVFLRRSVTNGACDPTLAAFALGAPSSISGETFRRNGYSGPNTSGPSCFSNGNYGPRSVRSYRLDNEITGTLPSASRIGSGTARLVPALVYAPGGRQLVPGWRDTQRKEDCTFAVAADGKTRCLPVASHATVLYTDAACKGQRVAGLDEASCDTDKPTVALELSTGTCPITTKVYAIGISRDLTTASQATAGGRCVTLAGAKNVYTATEVDPSSYIEGVATMD